MINNQLRPDEEFVIRSLAAHFSGDWWPGENPPDAYLKVGDAVTAVEISTLTQHVSDGTGGSKPRLSEDATAIWLANELNSELRDNIPDGWLAILVLASPILKARKVKAQLKERIITLVSSSRETEVTECILDNCIKIHVAPDDRPSGKKVVGVVSSQKSSPNILLNARNILEDRLVVKAGKCRFLNFEGPLWLALFNDYWLADNDTYQQAIETFSVDHSFKKILLVSGNKSVVELHEKHNPESVA
jgi:hypothetical protein